MVDEKTPLLLDACVTINLVASGVPLSSIASACDVQFLTTETAAREALFLTDGPILQEIDISQLAADGAIVLVEISESELDDFVRFAAQVDDGEASTFAVAISRGIVVATDDKKARRLAADLSPPIPLVGTCELLKTWSEAAADNLKLLPAALKAIESRASFVPRVDDPLREWWREAVNG